MHCAVRQALKVDDSTLRSHVQNTLIVFQNIHCVSLEIMSTDRAFGIARESLLVQVCPSNRALAVGRNRSHKISITQQSHWTCRRP